MKKVVLTCLLLMGVFSMTQMLAVRSSSGFKVMQVPAMQLQSQMTVNDFLAFDTKNYRTTEGRKMGFFKRTAIHLVQKKLAKKVSKGKIEGTMPFKEAVAGHANNKFGLLSVIFGAVGLFIPYVGLPLLIAGLVLGIMGIKRDANPTLAIIGTAINGAFLLLVLIALVAISSGFFWF